jgi:beta-lactamase superfamily II metal-dependent hydrolase
MSGEGGENEVFEPVISDIISILDGAPLDLYVMTHEHMDHVQGLLWYASNILTEQELIDTLQVRDSWLPVSADPDYYASHPEAKKKFGLAANSYRALMAFRSTLDKENAEQLEILLKNNNRFEGRSVNGLSSGRTADCVEFLRRLAGDNTHYVYRSVGQPTAGVPLCDITGKHTFEETVFEIWGPEEDSSEYYGQFKPLAFNLEDGGEAAMQVSDNIPPNGVDVGRFYNLVKHRISGLYENMLAIDKAANNSSIVFYMEWGGWRLVFPGDAEERSWKEMNKEGVLKEVDFLKISHHGSHNGTPHIDILERILPQANAASERHAAISTFDDTYSGIPHTESLDELEGLGCTLHSTKDTDIGKAIEIKLRRK